MNNDSHNFFQRSERRKPLQPVSGTQRVDNVSGFSFQKRAKTEHNTSDTRRALASPESPIRVRPVSRFDFQAANDRYDEQIRSHLISPASPETDTTSLKTTTTIATSQLINNFPDAPPRSIKPHEYYRHIPSNLKKDTRLRQLLYWFAQNEIRDDNYMVQTKNPVVEKVKEQLLEKLRSSDTIISLSRRRNNVEEVAKNTLVNEKLKEKSIQIKKDIEDAKTELEAWQACEDKLFEEHAIAMDRVKEQRSNDFCIPYELDFIDDIDPEQREFVARMQNKPEHKISDIIADMNSDVTNFRQILNTANQFVNESDTFIKKFKKELLEKVEEESRMIPIDADVRVLGPNENTKEKRKQDELRNLETLIRLSTRQQLNQQNDKLQDTSDQMDID